MRVRCQPVCLPSAQLPQRFEPLVSLQRKCCFTFIPMPVLVNPFLNTTQSYSCISVKYATKTPTAADSWFTSFFFLPCLGLSDRWSACVRWKTHLAPNALMEPVFKAVIRWFGIVREALLLQADARFVQSEVKRRLVSDQSRLYREGVVKEGIERALACVRWWFVLSMEFSGEQEADSFQLWPGSTTQVWEKRRQNNEFCNFRSETARQPKKHTNKSFK